LLKDLARFEWRYHTRQPSFVAACALFFILGFVLTATGFGPANVLVTSPWLVTEVLAFVSLFSVFAAAVFVANAVLRDTDHRMEEIVFTTPVGRFPYLFGRFGGALAAGISAMALAPLGMILGTRMPSLDQARVGPLHTATFLWPLLTIVLPTLLFVTALLFTFAVLTRSALATYTASVFIYLLYLAGAALTNSPLMAASRPGSGGSGIAAALLDPFGMSSFFEVTRYWTIAEKNTRLVPLTGALLLNRALWIVAAVVLCAIAYRSFSFRLPRRKRVKAEKTQPPAETITAYVRVEPAPRNLASFWSATKFEISAALRSRPFQLLLALWFILAVIEIRSDLFSGEYGSASYAATALIVAALQQPLMIVGLIIVIYYGSEIFWREQRFRVASIIDATPVPGTTLALAKWSAITALIATTIALGTAAGVVVQATHGYFAFEPALYLSLFYFAGLPLALYAAAAVAIHALSPGKYAGLALVLFFFLAMRNLPMIGLEHPIWRFGSASVPSYSAMYGFRDAATFGALMLHWSVWAAAMIGVAAVSWRHLSLGVADRVRTLGRWVTTRGRKPVAALVVALIATGGFVFYEANVVTVYQPRSRAIEWRVQYEQRYRRLAALPQPRITNVTANVDIFPEERRAHIAGEYQLRNDSDAPVKSIIVTMPRGARDVSVSVASSRRTSDNRFGVHVLDLEKPLQRNEHAKLTFAMTLAEGVEENGTVLMTFTSFPSLGYRATYEISDPRERARQGLGKSSTPEVEDSDAVSSTTEMDRVMLDATISTSRDQTAITSGHLDRQWTANGRGYFHYRSDAPMRNRFTFLSARYVVATAKAERQWPALSDQYPGGVASRRPGTGHWAPGTRAVDVSIAYHPAHAANVKAMLATAIRTLDYCNEAFGSYPYRQLKLAEVSTSWNFGGYALPDTILFSERRMFLVDARDAARPDLVTRRVAHEVAHQWWGYQLEPQSRGGASTLTESLAKYTELMVLERSRGRDQVRELLGIELDRYLAGRSGEEQHERTLANVGDQAYLYYSKGALVLHAVRDLIGERALNAALHRLLDQNRDTATATSLDLLRELRNVSTPAQFALIDEWFEKIVLYDFKVDAAEVTPLPNGRFRVVAHVTAAKREAAEDGVERDVPLDEEIDVALFRAGGIDAANLIATQRVHLRTGPNEIAFVTAEKPLFIVADPDLLRIDRNRADNVRRVH
jgi:ABC-type transport system involved in multi-copper enzyme maturation permease subunit